MKHPTRFKYMHKSGNLRLEQLEDASGWKKLAEQSQEENLTKINELRKNLEIAWAKEKKIESINVCFTLLCSAFHF